MKRLALLLTYMTISMLGISGCGFHLRNSNEIPAALHTIYFNAENPSNPTAVALRSTLSALHIKMVSKPSLARFSLNLTRPNLQNSNLENTNSNNNTNTVYNITYTISSNLSITNNKAQQTIASTVLTASQQQLLNRSQILTSNTNTNTVTVLSKAIADRAFLWLTTSNVKSAVSPNNK